MDTYAHYLDLTVVDILTQFFIYFIAVTEVL